jgi:spermidine/putrescine transport system ATP-binding protein
MNVRLEKFRCGRGDVVTDTEATDTAERVRGQVDLEALTKRFGTSVAVESLNLQVRAGEFLSLLGPSGCGKTTTLRMVSGFEAPSEGTIKVSGRNMDGVPPHRRQVNTVFQNYALFKHLTVAENIAFGLQVAKKDRATITRRVGEVLDLVQLPGVEKRYPAQLSGGQQQRVALARAVINEPEVLLLDEPLSALDLKLRQAMRFELSRLHRDLGMTFVFVTHDQEEAITMSDRIAVMNLGRLEQLGTPEDIYERPASRFVASFIGETNLLEGIVTESQDHHVRMLLAGGETVSCATSHFASTGDGLTISVRPQRVAVGASGSLDTTSHVVLKATMRELLFMGDSTRAVMVFPDGQEFVALRHNAAEGQPFTGLRPGDIVDVGWRHGAAWAVGA